MSLSPSTKALLQAARADAPSAAARAKIWSGVGAGSATAATVGAATAGKAALAGSAKLLALGALLGSTVTVGVAAFALRLGPSLQPDPTYAIAPERANAAIAPAARTLGAASLDAPAVAPSAAPVAAPAPRVDRPHPRDRDPLAREAALLAEARGALVRGQPEMALSAIQAARALPTRALEPETLALQSRALRAAGRFDEADAVEADLRARFPENALAR